MEKTQTIVSLSRSNNLQIDNGIFERLTPLQFIWAEMSDTHAAHFRLLISFQGV
jgi:hypothetical protein